MSRKIELSPEALADLLDLHDDIAPLPGQVFWEMAPGAKIDRTQLRKAQDAGDVLMVTRLDRLAKSTRTC